MRTISTFLSVGLAVLLVSGLNAQQAGQHGGIQMGAQQHGVQTHEYSQQGQKATSPASSAEVAEKATILRYSEFIGLKVKDTRKEDLGDIKSMVIDSSLGDIRYAVLSFTGLPSVTDKLFAAPWHALKLHKEMTNPAHCWVALNFDRERLPNAPCFNKEMWPDFADAKLTCDLDAFYGVSTAVGTATEAAGVPRFIRGCELAELDVKNAQDENLGTITDLVLDVQRGRIIYVVMSYGGFLGIGDNLSAVPWTTIRLTHDMEDVNLRWCVLDIGKDYLRSAPSFADNAWPNFADTRWTQEVDRFYSSAQRAAQQPSAVQRR